MSGDAWAHLVNAATDAGVPLHAVSDAMVEIQEETQQKDALLLPLLLNQHSAKALRIVAESLEKAVPFFPPTADHGVKLSVEVMRKVAYEVERTQG